MVRIGIIGMGRIGRVHAESIAKSVPNAKLAAVADFNLTDAIRDWAKGFGITRLYSDYHAIIEDEEIDAVFICTPTAMHAKISMETINAGKHVFCEKPVALSLAETRDVIKLLEGKNVKYQVGFNQRSDHNYVAVKNAILAGKIGKPHVVKITSRDPAPPPIEYIKGSGGIFLDMMIHDFDLVRYLTGCEPVEVCATGACLVDDAIGEAGDVDTAVATLKMENGAIAVIDNSRQCAYGYDQRVEVFGELGMAYANNETPTTTVVATKDGVTGPRPEGFFLERYRKSYAAEIASFIRSIENDTAVASSIYDGLMNATIGLAAQKSLTEGRCVRISEISD